MAQHLTLLAKTWPTPPPSCCPVCHVAADLQLCKWGDTCTICTCDQRCAPSTLTSLSTCSMHDAAAHQLERACRQHPGALEHQHCCLCCCNLVTEQCCALLQFALMTLSARLLLQDAVLGVIAEGKYRTGDLGGKAKTSEFTRAIIDKMD